MAEVQNQSNVNTVAAPMKKLFVGGLSPETSEQDLKEYFSKFGDVETIHLMTDPNTGNSKGFAFIVFNGEKSVNDAIRVTEHTIKNKKVDVEKAKVKQGKLFVAGLTSDLTDDDIRNYFSSYGKIVQAHFPFDKTKNVRKTFGFITFETVKPVCNILKTPKHMINNEEVNVSRCMDQQQKSNRYNDNSGFQVRGFNNFNNGGRQINNTQRGHFGNRPNIGGNFNNRSSNNFNRGSYQQETRQSNRNISFQNNERNQGQYQYNGMNQGKYQNNGINQQQYQYNDMNQGQYQNSNISQYQNNGMNRRQFQNNDMNRRQIQNNSMDQDQYRNDGTNQRQYQNNGINQRPNKPFNNGTGYQSYNTNSQNNFGGGKWQTQRFQRQMPY